MPQVYVADVLCGGGKTTAAINYINESDPDKKFIFVTPYLPECLRIVANCSAKNFMQPNDEKLGRQRYTTKLSDMRVLLYGHNNIASTHALFPKYTEDMLEIIRSQKYTLIMDESYDVAKPLSNQERLMFFDESEKGTIQLDENGRAHWCGGAPSPGSQLLDLYRAIENGAVYGYGKSLLIWMFPPEILLAFDTIIILTHMFDCQTLRYYLDLLGLSYTYMATKYDGATYRFCSPADNDRVNPYAGVSRLIHILNNDRLEKIGQDEHALSATWYERDERGDQAQIRKLGRHIKNVQKNIFACPIRQFMWTMYKQYREMVEDKNIRNTFVPWNKKATNDYRECQYLAYGINLYAQPDACKYFSRFGVKMDIDRWALSEMIQWIWRSAIRDGKEIWIYVPSKRMKTLLENWLIEVDGNDDLDAADKTA